MGLKTVTAWRSCYVQIPGNIELIPSTRTDQPHTYRGTLSDIMNLMSSISSRGFFNNCTMVESDSFGTYNAATGKYSGCLGVLESNGSEASAAVVEYPIKDLSVIEPFQVLFENKLKLMTSYNTSDGTEKVDIISSLAVTFNPVLWFMILVAGITGSIMIAIINKVLTKYERLGEPTNIVTHSPRRSRRELYILPESTAPIYEAMTHLIHFESVEYECASRRIISISLTVFGFFMIQLLFGFMNGDLIVVVDPEIIRDYDDLLSYMRKTPPMVPSFIDTWVDYNEFKYASPGSIQAEIWQEIKHQIATNKTVFMKVGSSTVLPWYVMEGLRMERGLLVSGMIYKLVHTTMCRLKGSMSDLYPNSQPWIASDPRSVAIQRGVVKRIDFRSHPVSKNIEKYSKRLFESSVVTPLQESMSKGFFTEIPADPKIIKLCLWKGSNFREDDNKELIDFGIDNFAGLAFFYLSLLFISSVMFVAEKLMDYCWRIRPSRKVRDRWVAYCKKTRDMKQQVKEQTPGIHSLILEATSVVTIASKIRVNNIAR